MNLIIFMILSKLFTLIAPNAKKIFQFVVEHTVNHVKYPFSLFVSIATQKTSILKIKQGVTRFPLCSMVYYVMVDNLRGGKLHIEDEVITPKTNRLVIFSPGKYHCVEPFIGSRTTYCINPWDVKL